MKRSPHYGVITRKQRIVHWFKMRAFWFAHNIHSSIMLIISVAFMLVVMWFIAFVVLPDIHNSGYEKGYAEGYKLGTCRILAASDWVVRTQEARPLTKREWDAAFKVAVSPTMQTFELDEQLVRDLRSTIDGRCPGVQR